MKGVGDGRSESRRHRHRQECCIDPIPIGKSKTDIRRSTGGIDFQFFTKPPNELHDLDSCGPHGTDRHHQRIDNHISSRNTMILGTFDNLFCHFETDIRIFGDPGFIIGNGNHGTVVFLDQRKYRFQAFLFPGYRVEQGLSLIDFQTCFQRSNNGGINGQRNIRQGLDQFDRFCKDSRFIREWNACVDVKHMGTGCNLGQGILFHSGKISLCHFLREHFSTGGIDPLTDDHKRLIKSNPDFFSSRANNGFSHIFVNIIDLISLFLIYSLGLCQQR